MTLDQYLRDCETKEFSWPSWNCWHFVSGWAAMKIGRDPLAGAVPRETSFLWHLWVARMGGIEAWVSRQLPEYAQAPACSAVAGDVVLLPGDSSAWVLGISNGRLSAALRSTVGIAFTDAAPLATWKIKK